MVMGECRLVGTLRRLYSDYSPPSGTHHFIGQVSKTGTRGLAPRLATTRPNFLCLFSSNVLVHSIRAIDVLLSFNADVNSRAQPSELHSFFQCHCVPSLTDILLKVAGPLFTMQRTLTHLTPLHGLFQPAALSTPKAIVARHPFVSQPKKMHRMRHVCCCKMGRILP